MHKSPPVEEIIHDLLYQAAVGNAHMKVAEGLSRSDPVVLNAAKTFFAMTIDAHLYSALMAAARIHDDQHNAVTIDTLMERAANEPAKHDNGGEVQMAIEWAKAMIKGLDKELKHLKKWRNRRLAHNQSTLTDPAFAAQEFKKWAGDLRKIFRGTSKILNEFSWLYRDIYAPLNIIDQTDYRTVIEYVTDAKCRQVRDYEKMTGEPADFPRPRDYNQWLERQRRR
jgi:hypothetical protein